MGEVRCVGQRTRGGGDPGCRPRPAHALFSSHNSQELLPLIKGELRDYQLKGACVGLGGGRERGCKGRLHCRSPRMPPRPHPAPQSPSLGVKWLISLYQNGLNGILADQMGLGKTVQTIGFLSHLRSKGVHGAFLIVGPLSTLPNWVAEVERWAPTFPAVLYHGNKDERAALRHERLGPPGAKVTEAFPIVVTSYEIVLADAKFLGQYKWKYIVVDEGHRLKNMNCRLLRELRTIPTANKLLLTGGLGRGAWGWAGGAARRILTRPTPATGPPSLAQAPPCKTICPSCGRCSTSCCPTFLGR